MSHSTSTSDKEIVLVHNGDWSGDVTVVAHRHGPQAQFVPRSAETIIPADQLISGDFERPRGCQLTERELRRAVALAMHCYVISHIAKTLEQCPAPGLL